MLDNRIVSRLLTNDTGPLGVIATRVVTTSDCFVGECWTRQAVCSLTEGD